MAILISLGLEIVAMMCCGRFIRLHVAFSLMME